MGGLLRRDRDDVAVLVLDDPDRSVNIVNAAVLEDLDAHLAAISLDPTIAAVVLASGKADSFGLGADLDWLPELARREDAMEFLEAVHGTMVRMSRSIKPIVAALNGRAFGGALELALAATELLATPDAMIGLPEVTIGLIPGGGGTQLLQRLVDPQTALSLLTSGRTVTADEALEFGLVAKIVPADDLIGSAVASAKRLAAEGSPHRRVIPDPLAADRMRAELISNSGLVTQAKSAVLDVVRVGLAHGLEAGLAAERAAFMDLLRGREFAAAMHLRGIQARTAAELADAPEAGHAASLLGVVGGGQMGSGIAAVASARGLDSIVRDVDPVRLAAAGQYRERVVARDSRPGRLVGDWSSTTEWTGFDGVSAVIEAVFELPAVKSEVLREISERVAGDALIATNTSAISIGGLALDVTHPERFLGMHFFSPVDRMPLVELIPHEGTSPLRVADARRLAARLGKTPITVADRPGFFTSRVYARWLLEGVQLLLDGIDVKTIDDAARSRGFPVGPLRAIDEATLQLVVDASVDQVAGKIMADRLDVPKLRSALRQLIDAGAAGKRAGLGFYEYSAGKRVGPNRRIASLLGITPSGLSGDEVAERLFMTFVNECALCLKDGTLESADDGDIGAVLGIGFPRHLGGPFFWVAGNVTPLPHVKRPGNVASLPDPKRSAWRGR